MSYLITFLVFGLCFVGMAIGIIFAKKVLRKGCSADPTDPNATCACKAEEESSLDDGDDLLQIQPGLKSKKKS